MSLRINSSRLYQHTLLNIRSQRGTLSIERVNPPPRAQPPHR